MNSGTRPSGPRTVRRSPAAVAGRSRGLAALLLPVAASVALAAGSAVAELSPVPVINYRNDGTGVYPEAKPLLKWNATLGSPEGVVWCTPLPGPAEVSQPVIGDDRIYVQSVSLTLSCLDKLTGKVLWQRDKHAQSDAKAGAEEDKAFRLERYVEFCEKEIIGRFGSMKGKSQCDPRCAGVVIRLPARGWPQDGGQ